MGNSIAQKYQLFLQILYNTIEVLRVFRAQADWTLTHTSHKDTEQSTIKASITLDGLILTDSLIRRSQYEWFSVCREIPVSADKMFWTSNKPAQWTHYTYCDMLSGRPESESQSESQSQSQSYITTNSQSASLSWNKAPIWGVRPDIYLSLTIMALFLWASFLTRGRVWLLYMLLALASVVFLGSESLWTRNHILLSRIWDFPFCRLLRLAGSRWRYSTPPPHKARECRIT
jgi:hypothetical protein